MKKLLVILFVVLTGLILSSCILDTALEDSFDFQKSVLAVFRSDYDREVTDAVITTMQGATGDVLLTVNGVQCELDYVDSALGKVLYHFNVDYIEFGSTFNYVLQVGEEQYSGSIEHPDRYEVTFPEFDFDNDYTFNWTLTSNPQYQYLDYFIRGEGEDGWDEVSDVITLKDSDRSYTLEQDKWSLFNNVENVNIALAAHNMKTHGANCVVSAISEAFYNEGSWEDLKTNGGKSPRVLR